MLVDVVPQQSAQVGAFYDRMGSYFATVYGGDSNIHFGYWDDAQDLAEPVAAQDRLTRMALEWLKPRPQEWLLDVGCGRGGPGRLAARESGCSVAGVSVSRSQVDQAHAAALAEGLGGRVRVQHADALQLPFPAGSFGSLWALESVFHMADRAKVFTEMARVLVPGGRVAITDIVQIGPMSEELAGHLTRTLMCAPLARIEEYGEAVAVAGLRVERVRDISVHSRRSVEQIHARHLDHEQELRRYCGDEFIDGLLVEWPVVLEAFGESLGYVFVTAEKPGAV